METKNDLGLLIQEINEAHERYLKEKDRKTKAVYKREWRQLKSKHLYFSQKKKIDADTQ